MERDLPKMTVRRATMEDAEAMFRWSADPESRRQSFSTGEITWESHVKWLGEKIKDENYCIYIGLDESGKQVAMCRFWIDGDRATIGATTDPALRGKGYGTAVIHLGTAQLFKDKAHIKAVDGYVKPSNPACVYATNHAGWRIIDEREMKGEKVVYMTVTREEFIE